MNTTDLIDAVKTRFPDAVTASHDFRGDATVILQRHAVLEVAQFLKDEPVLAMNLLVDLSVVDYSTFGEQASRAFFASSGVPLKPSPLIEDEAPWPGPPEGGRFAVVYHFYSTGHKHRLRLVVPVEEGVDDLDSVTTLWPVADWLEREAWDMFGVSFRGHPNLKRILMYEGFEGHPLRKDYPVNKRQPLIGPLN